MLPLLFKTIFTDGPAYLPIGAVGKYPHLSVLMHTLEHKQEQISLHSAVLKLGNFNLALKGLF